AVRTDNLDITSGQAAGKTSFNLVFGRNEFAVQDISAAFAGGTATGGTAIRRAGGDVSFAVRLAMKQADLSELVWRSGGGPAGTGRIDLTADMLGTGKTIAAVVENLTGSGSFTIRDAALGAVDAGAFERTLIAVEAGTESAGADDIAR